MKKKFVALMTILGLSAALAGCGKTEAPVVPETTIETEVQENESTNTTAEEAPAEEVTTEEVDATGEEAETPVTQELAEVKEDTSKPEDKKEPAATETKPSTNNLAAAKPNTNTSANKPSTNTSTSKPSTGTSTSKPSTPSTNSPSNSTPVKPEATPEVKPEVKPETTPEVKPEATPEVKPETTSLSANEVFSSITSGLEFPAQMEVDATLLSDLYGIDTSLLESYCVKMPMMSAHIAEVGVFKVKDANNVNSIVAGINKRAGNVGQCLYPSLQETFDARVIATKGNYILFAMDEGASTIQANFNNLIK